MTVPTQVSQPALEEDQAPTIEQIRAYWNKRATLHGADLTATTPDTLLKELEIDALRRVLDPDLLTLEAGCGNGYNLLKLGETFRGPLVGVDYARGMIDAAVKAAVAADASDRISFHVGSVLEDLGFLGRFPQIFTDRCLINLPSLDMQIEAVQNLAEILLPGGRLALVECSRQAQERLNGLRQRVGLSPIPLHWHNLQLDEEAFLARIPPTLEHLETDNFGSLYYVASRVFNAKITPAGEAPDYMAAINRIARELPSFGDYGPHKLFLFEKVS